MSEHCTGGTDRSIKELIDEIHNRGIVPETTKPVNYLGWYWREIEYATISYHDGKLWINAAKKWGYPFYKPDEIEPIREKIKELLVESLEDERPPNRKEFQRFLAGQVDDRFSRCDYDSGEKIYYELEFDDDTTESTLRTVEPGTNHSERGDDARQ